MIKWTITFSLFFTIYSIAYGQRTNQEGSKLNGLDSEIETLIKQYHAAGLAVAVIQNGKSIYRKGFGYRNYEQKIPADEHTVFGIGSCTKAFTASVLGILQEEGRLDFKDRPSKYIENLEFATQGMNDSVRIHHLLTHTTGLSITPSECTAVLFTSANKYDLVPRIKYINSTSGVGQDWIYNNLMYSLAGMVSEQPSGKSIESNWEEMIFEPLGMTNTYAKYEDAAKNSNFSFGYTVQENMPSKVIEEDMAVRGAGGAIYSTVSDMSRWMQLWLDKGRLDGLQILPEKYIDAAMDTLVLIASNPNDSISVPRYYGYGWSNWYHKGYKRTEHSGGISGYVSNVVLYPNENLGIVVLSNQTTTTLPSKVNNLIVERLLPELKENKLDIQYGQAFNIGPIDTPTIPDSIQMPSLELSELVGTYYHPGYGEIEVTLKHKTLYADFPYTKFRLEYIGNDTFIDHFTEQVPHAYWNFLDFKFEKNDHGEVNRVLLNLDTNPVSFEKLISKY